MKDTERIIDKDTSSRWTNIAIIVVCAVAVICFVMLCCFLFDNRTGQSTHVDAVGVEEIYQSDEKYMTELTALATALAMPKDVLHRSFTDTWYYVGGVLQSDNLQTGKNSITFDRKILERVLNDIDFWIMTESEFGTADAYTKEINLAKSTTEETISSISDDNLGAGYKKYVMRERMENNPNLVSMDFYDNQIIYIFESTYYRYVISFIIGGNGKIVDYKVILGQ